MSPLVLTHAAAPVVTVTLNRPAQRNALDVALLGALAAALRAAAADPALRVLVLRGAGPVFCAGLDLAAVAEPGRAEPCIRHLHSILLELADSRLVTVAAVQGAALAGGAGLAGACDFVLATRDAKFGFPEVRRGIVPALLVTFLRRQLRERDAREFLLLGKLFPAAHALAAGLVNRVVDDETALELELRAMLGSLLQAGPDALAETKRLLRAAWPTTLAADLAAAAAVHLAGRDAAEAAEALAAAREKRPPMWAPR
jgi:methylglutaconyl-CoA hydratase